MLGVNELGWYNDQRYYDNYADLIDLIREVQPEAQIYLQTLIPVTSKKSAGSYINNPRFWCIGHYRSAGGGKAGFSGGCVVGLCRG